MSYFIELEGRFVNVDKIVSFERVESKNNKYTVIYLDATILERVYTDETPDEIMRKIMQGLKTCGDCISRKDALKAIEDEKQGWEGVARYVIDECHTRIADLPPVRPKTESED